MRAASARCAAVTPLRVQLRQTGLPGPFRQGAERVRGRDPKRMTQFPELDTRNPVKNRTRAHRRHFPPKAMRQHTRRKAHHARYSTTHPTARPSHAQHQAPHSASASPPHRLVRAISPPLRRASPCTQSVQRRKRKGPMRAGSAKSVNGLATGADIRFDSLRLSHPGQKQASQRRGQPSVRAGSTIAMPGAKTCAASRRLTFSLRLRHQGNDRVGASPRPRFRRLWARPAKGKGLASKWQTLPHHFQMVPAPGPMAGTSAANALPASITAPPPKQSRLHALRAGLVQPGL